MCLGLITIQILVILIWLLVDIPEARPLYPTERYVLVCEIYPLHLFLAQFYNIVLCVVTTAYSILTRKLPDSFNESRFINLSMYSVCVAWILETVVWVFREDLDKDESVLQYYPEVCMSISSCKIRQ